MWTRSKSAGGRHGLRITPRVLVTAVVAATAPATILMAACATAPTSTAEPSAASTSAEPAPSPTVPSIQPAPSSRPPTSPPPLPFPDSGNPLFDTGYLAGPTVPPGECERKSKTIAPPDYIDQRSGRTAYLMGCLAAQAGYPPIYDNPLIPAGPAGQSYEFCLDGAVGPWIVLYSTPSGSGDITVGARCEQEAEAAARAEIPDIVHIIDTWAL